MYKQIPNDAMQCSVQVLYLLLMLLIKLLNLLSVKLFLSNLVEYLGYFFY